MKSFTAELFVNGIKAISKSNESGSLKNVVKTIIRSPLKIIAAFIFAPLLAFRVALSAKNPIRRAIAIVGLVIGGLLAWVAGTFLGTLAGGLFMLSAFGPLIALGFLIGTTISITLSVAFSIIVLNATSWVFLSMSSEDVIEYLNSISE